MTTVIFPDVLGDTRAWTRGLNTPCGTRVFFRIPEHPVFPLTRIYRTGGGVQPGETPVQDMRLAWDVIGGEPSDFAAVSRTIQQLESALHQLWATPIGASTYVLNAQAGTVVDAPDPDTGAPRMVLDALLTVRMQ